ncbi:hypothetical protein M3Y96_00186800 [Aphelenchoides besseyi]|nr:hypothetical protein M3Y96_00186800 [Aphelenchoides besseyi]
MSNQQSLGPIFVKDKKFRKGDQKRSPSPKSQKNKNIPQEVQQAVIPNSKPDVMKKEKNRKCRRQFLSSFCERSKGARAFEQRRLSSEPKPGTLTGDFLPCIPLAGWRCISTAEMDRALACGPTKDPVVHRGIRIERDSIPSFPSKSPITVITLLSVPLASRQNLIERGAMEMIQSMLCYHYAKEGRHTSEILELFQYLARIFETQLPDAKKEQHKTECRAIVLQTLLMKRKLSDEQLAKFMIEMGKFIEVDKEQIDGTLEALRKRDKLNEQQVDRVRQELWNEIRAAQSDTIPLINLQRSVLGALKTPNRS